PPEPGLFWVVVHIIRLAHEYQVHHLRRRALLHVEAIYPTSIDADRISDDSEYTTDLEPGVNCCDLIALQLALEIGALWNIPCIIYDCCTSDLGSLLNLSEWDDLPAPQTRRILVAHGKQKYGTRLVSRFLLTDHPHGNYCATSAACKDAKLRWLVVLDRRYSLEGGDSDPLTFWGEEEADWVDMEREFCGVCVARNAESYQEARVEFWQGLTESLGLPKW
ncbi:hypothetical protein B0H14DRAFT_2262812, partial [Mycena olivaceomarginata]